MAPITAFIVHGLILSDGLRCAHNHKKCKPHNLCMTTPPKNNIGADPLSISNSSEDSDNTNEEKEQKKALSPLAIAVADCTL